MKKRYFYRNFNHFSPSEVSGEPEDFDPLAARRHVPPTIPTEPIENEEEENGNGHDQEEQEHMVNKFAKKKLITPF